MIHRFGHVTIAVSDMDKALAFYRDFLGLKVVNDYDTEVVGPERQAFYKNLHAEPNLHFRKVRLVASDEAQGMALELNKWYSPSGKSFPSEHQMPDTGYHTVGFGVTQDIQAIYQKMVQAGVKVVSTPQNYHTDTGLLTAFKFYDPDGNCLEVIQRKP